MDLANRRVGQTAANVWLASPPTGSAIVRVSRPALVARVFVAQVINVRPVINLRLGAAVLPTPPQFGVERVQGLRIELRQRDRTEKRPDVNLVLRFIAATGQRFNVRQRQIPLHQLGDGRPSLRVPLFVDLVE